jgi:predicted methyltransferase
MAKLNFQNLSREDKEAIIDIADRILRFKERMKKEFNIAENYREFNEMADNSCVGIFYSSHIFDFKLDENNDEGAN